MSDFELVSDMNGNMLKMPKKHGEVLLKLGKSAVRIIGQIRAGDDGRIIYIKSNLKEAEHVFRKANSWGLCHAVIERLPKDATIIINSDIASYKITVEKALKIGKFLFFKEQGFEKQFFVRLEDFDCETYAS